LSPTWIRARIRYYAQLVGLGYVPTVVFSQKDWQRTVPARSHGDAHGSYGASESSAGVVYVNLSRACCKRGTDDTCAHEVIHLRWENLRHGAKFDHYVSEMLLGRIPDA